MVGGNILRRQDQLLRTVFADMQADEQHSWAANVDEFVKHYTELPVAQHPTHTLVTAWPALGYGEEVFLVPNDFLSWLNDPTTTNPYLGIGESKTRRRWSQLGKTYVRDACDVDQYDLPGDFKDFPWNLGSVWYRWKRGGHIGANEFVYDECETEEQ